MTAFFAENLKNRNRFTQDPAKKQHLANHTPQGPRHRWGPSSTAPRRMPLEANVARALINDGLTNFIRGPYVELSHQVSRLLPLDCPVDLPLELPLPPKRALALGASLSTS
ncbi:hypothetical protein Rmet_0708 [Cupriavidus metallidurans CH34]|uniref:Uncharacterized protein n=1 Tax=Cupriavidus metallidurans (strain ATCC 43123 / DSM 2839 / NBRC 102507 / CH34) TaxID=266264 RepID=Q1LQI2_CUPMC|nr:hypothetical protein Rmet_0708 [Cupriavidus metallidurans CH34]